MKIDGVSVGAANIIVMKTKKRKKNENKKTIKEKHNTQTLGDAFKTPSISWSVLVHIYIGSITIHATKRPWAIGQIR